MRSKHLVRFDLTSLGLSTTAPLSCQSVGGSIAVVARTLLWTTLLFIMPASTESLKVAVLGGGAAGLAAARIMSRNGIRPLVLEKDEAVGGVWRYVPSSKTRPVYKGLRTNIPRELMAFREKPWGDGVGKSFVTHREVLDYLVEYQNDYDLAQYISLGSTVKHLRVLKDQMSCVSTRDGQLPKIEVGWEHKGQTRAEAFDAVCVANGHFSAPSIPKLDGIENFKGRTMHSIEYDDPSEFESQTVLCIGGRASGSDLAREMSFHAKHVYLSESIAKQAQTEENVTLVPRTIGIREDGSVEFAKDCPLSPAVDVIVYCTGYDYSMPFIDQESGIELSVVPGERRVAPLYNQIWHAMYPNLSFVGLQHSVVPFPLFEMQLEAIVHEWTAKKLPSQEERVAIAEAESTAGGLRKTGKIKDTHHLGARQWEYCRNVAKHADLYDDDMERYIKTNETLYDVSVSERKALFPGGPDWYRETRYLRDINNGGVRVLFCGTDHHLKQQTQIQEQKDLVGSEMWDHTAYERKGLFPGGDDIYRETRYSRDTTTFTVVASILEENAKAAAAA